MISFRNWYMLGSIERILDKHFPGETRPSLLELERNASLGLHFGHFAMMDGIRPLAPNFVYIGMMNCKEPKPLPEDLAQFLDSGEEHGVIYVAFG